MTKEVAVEVSQLVLLDCLKPECLALESRLNRCRCLDETLWKRTVKSSLCLRAKGESSLRAALASRIIECDVVLPVHPNCPAFGSFFQTHTFFIACFKMASSKVVCLFRHIQTNQVVVSTRQYAEVKFTPMRWATNKMVLINIAWNRTNVSVNLTLLDAHHGYEKTTGVHWSL